MRYLFVLPTTALMGGVKVVLELAQRLAARGETAHVFSFAGPPRWRSPHATLLPEHDLEAVDFTGYDFVLACNAFLLPLLLPRLDGTGARPIFFCQDYESFHHGDTPAYDAFVADAPTFTEIYRLPLPILATSHAVQRLMRERVGRESWYMPVAIDTEVFRPQPRPPATTRKRVLFVANYLMPYKGIREGIEAMRRLSRDLDLTLVLVTQEERGRELFLHLPFPVEVHLRPSEEHMPGIYAGCDLYCCASWYEGLGLPALEAFACGTPVVSTRTYGVSEYGRDAENLLLAEPNDPADLADKIGRVLTDPVLAERLCAGGFRTVAARATWPQAVDQFQIAVADINRAHPRAAVVDPDAMDDLLTRLENEGNVTPIAVFREFQRLSRGLDAVCESITATRLMPANGRAALTDIRDALGRHLINERAEYHAAFKAKFDLCQLLLAFADSYDLPRYVDRIAGRGVSREQPAAAAFSEIRYPLA